MKKLTISFVSLLVIFFLAGYFFWQSFAFQFYLARRLEKQHQLEKAINKYHFLIERYPTHQKAPEALYRVGGIYLKKLQNYPSARETYSKFIDKYPSHPLASGARRNRLDAPDYFPLPDKSVWTIGDSQTGGKNMKMNISAELYGPRRWPNELVKVNQKIFAGEKLFNSTDLYYEKEKDQLCEFYYTEQAAHKVVYKYPLEPGQSWVTKDKEEEVTCTIEEKNLTVKVRAGEFAGCLKIRETYARMPNSWRFNYYAPFVGKILTTVKSREAKEETRQSELISYSLVK